MRSRLRLYDTFLIHKLSGWYLPSSQCFLDLIHHVISKSKCQRLKSQSSTTNAKMRHDWRDRGRISCGFIGWHLVLCIIIWQLPVVVSYLWSQTRNSAQRSYITYNCNISYMPSFVCFSSAQLILYCCLWDLFWLTKLKQSCCGT